MKNVILIAPPAGGKGTQSKLLKDYYHLSHISTGDLLRSASQNNDEMGYLIKKIMEDGALVSDDIVLKLLKEAISCECNNGYVLDGFPRTLNQAYKYVEMLDELNIPLGDVIYLDIPKEVIKKRIIGRLSCPNCHAVYNDQIDENKPKEVEICDECHTTLVKRADDNEQTFENRYHVYEEQTYPLVNFFNEKGVLTTIKGNLSTEETFDMIKKVLDDKN